MTLPFLMFSVQMGSLPDTRGIGGLFHITNSSINLRTFLVCSSLIVAIYTSI